MHLYEHGVLIKEDPFLGSQLFRFVSEKPMLQCSEKGLPVVLYKNKLWYVPIKDGCQSFKKITTTAKGVEVQLWDSVWRMLAPFTPGPGK